MKSLIFASALLSLAPFAALADDVTKLSGIDLAVQTHKWEGKTVETTAFCFYADVNEFRCGSPNGARIDFSALEPEAARKSIESNCDTIQKMLRPACKVRIRFVYESYDTLPNSGGEETHVVIAKDNAGTIVGK